MHGLYQFVKYNKGYDTRQDNKNRGGAIDYSVRLRVGHLQTVYLGKFYWELMVRHCPSACLSENQYVGVCRSLSIDCLYTVNISYCFCLILSGTFYPDLKSCLCL